MSQCSCKNCDLEVFENSDKCILHCEKDSNFSNAELFLQNIIKLTFQKTVLENIIFPNVDAKDLNRFKKEKIIFKNCKFQGKITCTDSSIKPILEFQNCEFEFLILWEGITIENKISFKDSIFKDKFIVNKCIFLKNVNLEGVVYQHVADFSEAIFEDSIYQKYTLYEGYTTFRDVTFKKELNLRDTIFYDKVNFLNIIIKNVANRETARIIKDSFEQQNNIIEANKFYALEMKEREKELDKDVKKGKNIFEWLVFKIHRLASNHSQDWTLTLFWIFIVGFLASYFDFNLIQNEERKYIHFSVISIFKTIGLIFLIFCINELCKIKEKFVNGLYFVISFYLVYIYATQDYLLSLFSKTINPFSVMKTNDPINGIQLFFKIIIAYLIYQLIISIRQNTRRK